MSELQEHWCAILGIEPATTTDLDHKNEAADLRKAALPDN
jgi:hypothetical protein